MALPPRPLAGSGAPAPGPISGLYRLGRWLKCRALRYEGKRMNTIIALIKDEAGSSAVEYAFLVSLIAAVIAVSVTFLGSQLNAAYNLVASKIRLG
jgi:Flp pilus assembly pilin Flp